MNKLLSLLNILEDTLLVIYNFFFRYSQIWWKKKLDDNSAHQKGPVKKW